ncbi:MAG TPA: IS66 family transposase [Gammaproteobacteria bacterium]|nr:IS66 family transposase [Gammaproteobacteria bacterium]
MNELIINTEISKYIEALIVAFEKKEKAYKEEIRILKEQVQCLKNKLFGRRSEKIPKNDNQLPLFDFPEPALSDDEPETVVIPSHRRRKTGRKPLPDNLPRVDVIHDLPEEEKLCQCGCMKSRVGEEVSEQLDIIPAKIQVIRHVRYKYACKNCEGTDDPGPTVSIARMPDQVIPKSMATPGMIAHVLTGKFVDSLPFYRQEKQFKRMGVDLPRSTMCSWAMKVADACDILLDMFKEEILSGPLINIDETTVQVLKEPDKKPSTKSYMWVFRGGPPGKTTLLYQYHPTRSGDVAQNFLKGYQGVVQTDGYAGYNFLDQARGIDHIGCLAHVRRKFTDVTRAAGKPGRKKKPGHADTALKYIRKLYKIERKASEKGLSTQELYEERQARAKPILKEFKTWLDAMVNVTPPQGLLGKAVSYSLNQWHRVSAYVNHGIVKPDNNYTENAIRPFVVGRKNWLFSATPEGARASAALYSLVETDRANGIEPAAYLKHILENLPNAMTKDDFKELMPQYIDPSLLQIKP